MKRILSTALALALCLTMLPTTAMAAGTEKVVVNEEYGIKITMDGFLRVETSRYALYDDPTFSPEIYVVADNSTVTAEPLEGKKFALFDPYYYLGPAVPTFYNDREYVYANMSADRLPEYESLWDYIDNRDSYAKEITSFYEWNPDSCSFWTDGYNGHEIPLQEESSTITASPADSDDYDDTIYLDGSWGIFWLCESDFAKLVPVTTSLRASNWAQTEVSGAYDAGIMPFSPYSVDCTKGMTRRNFAETTVRLYAAMIGKEPGELGVNILHPFTDIGYDDYVGFAYNLGFVNGTGGTTFNPDGTLTRQEAAVMLSRVYAKVHGDIPNAANTTFADDADVANWAKSAVAFMSDKGIVNGVGDNRFAPTKTLSIEESMVMAYRMLEKLK